MTRKSPPSLSRSLKIWKNDRKRRIKAKAAFIRPDDKKTSRQQ
jgi:hypothetical protein